MASFAQHSVSNKKAFNTPFVLPDLRLCSQVKAMMLSQVSIVHGSIAHLGLAAPYLRAYRSGPFDGRPACQWWHCTFPALACLLRPVSGVPRWPQGQFAAPTATSWPSCRNRQTAKPDYSDEVEVHVFRNGRTEAPNLNSLQSSGTVQSSG